MMHLKNIKLDPSRTEHMYFRAEDGTDWYEAQKRFKKETIKIAYTDTGLIEHFTDDVSKVFPMNVSVVEVDKASLPVNFFEPNLRGFGYYDGKILPYVPTQEQMRLFRNQLLNMTDSLAQRYQEQTRAAVRSSITHAQYDEIVAYRQKLRDMPANGFVLPVPPNFTKLPILGIEG